MTIRNKTYTKNSHQNIERTKRKNVKKNSSDTNLITAMWTVNMHFSQINQYDKTYCLFYKGLIYMLICLLLLTIHVGVCDEHQNIINIKLIWRYSTVTVQVMVNWRRKKIEKIPFDRGTCPKFKFQQKQMIYSVIKFTKNDSTDTLHVSHSIPEQIYKWNHWLICVRIFSHFMPNLVKSRSHWTKNEINATKFFPLSFSSYFVHRLIGWIVPLNKNISKRKGNNDNQWITLGGTNGHINTDQVFKWIYFILFFKWNNL